MEGNWIQPAILSCRIFMGKTAVMGTHIEETLQSLKLVIAFSREDYALSKFEEQAGVVYNSGKNQAKTNGLFQGSLFFLIFMFFSYMYISASIFFENGWKNVRTGEPHTIGDIITTSEAIIHGLF